jgi:hypothetical protein
MKHTIYLIVLFLFIGLTWIGCSDQSPLDPIDQRSLEKVIITNFTSVSYPTSVTDPGKVKFADGNLILRGRTGTVVFESGNSLMNANGIITYNGNVDAITGEGPYWGTLTLTPESADGGKWELTWRGKCTKTGEMVWTLPLKVLGHGKGGSIDGMQIFMTNIVTYNEPVPTFWLGNSTGYIQSH